MNLRQYTVVFSKENVGNTIHKLKGCANQNGAAELIFYKMLKIGSESQLTKSGLRTQDPYINIHRLDLLAFPTEKLRVSIVRPCRLSLGGSLEIGKRDIHFEWRTLSCSLSKLPDNIYISVNTYLNEKVCYMKGLYESE